MLAIVLCRYWRFRRISKVHDTQYRSASTDEIHDFFPNKSNIFATSHNSMRKWFPFMVLRQHHESEFQEVSQVTLQFSIWRSFKLSGTRLPSLMIGLIARKRLLIVSGDTCNASANGRWFWIRSPSNSSYYFSSSHFVVYQSAHCIEQ